MRVGSPKHLVARFFGMLDPRPPSRTDRAWVLRCLGPGEQRYWESMTRADRRHSVLVARRVEADLGAAATRPVLAAALLHDVGKLDSRLGLYGRVIATLCAVFADASTAASWQTRRGFTRRVGLYLRHPEIGADMLAMAGSDPLTIAWTREHHLDPDRWTIDPVAARALKAADND